MFLLCVKQMGKDTVGRHRRSPKSILYVADVLAIRLFLALDSWHSWHKGRYGISSESVCRPVSEVGLLLTEF